MLFTFLSRFPFHLSRSPAFVRRLSAVVSVKRFKNALSCGHTADILRTWCGHCRDMVRRKGCEDAIFLAAWFNSLARFFLSVGLTQSIMNSSIKKGLVVMITIYNTVHVGYAFTTQELLAKYKKAISEITSMKYNLHRIDRFTNGDTWNKTGYCVIQRTGTSPGFVFFGKRDDHDAEFISSAKSYYIVNRKEGQFIRRDLDIKQMLGSPGGQMLVMELIGVDSVYQAVSHQENKESYYLKFEYTDDPEFDITDRYKIIYLNKKTFIPFKVEEHLRALGKTQTILREITEWNRNNEFEKEDYLNLSKRLLGLTEVVEAHPFAKKNTNVIAPDFTLGSFEGASVSLRALKGNLVLIDFWEVWCGPCIAAMPKIQALHDKYKAKGLVVIGITNEAESVESARLMINKKNISFLNLIGNGQVREAYQAYTIPKYVLLGRDLRIMYSSTGYTDELDRMISSALE